MNWIELTGTVFGVLCVVLYIRQNIWSWPTGLVQVVLFIFVFYDAKLYSDLLLHVVYVVLQCYGWYHWLYGGSNKEPLKATRLKPSELVGYSLIACLGAAALGYFMHTFTDAAAPWIDAFIATASLVAQWLITRKKLESWVFWIVVDVVAIGLYASKDLVFAATLYAIFLALAVTGFFAWKKTLDNASRPDSRKIRSAA